MVKCGVYILQSKNNKRYYIGSTDNMERRLKEHITGKVFTTRRIRPLIFKTFIKCDNLTEARQAEYRLKQYKRKDIIEKVVKDSIFPWDYKK